MSNISQIHLSEPLRRSQNRPEGPSWIASFATIDRTSLPLVGGKAANLGELCTAGFPVPDGFCVTTAAYDRVAAGTALTRVLDALDQAATLSAEHLSALAADARNALLTASIPHEIAEAIRAAYTHLRPDQSPAAVAVRSSATAEDLPDASFAGQQDTYLNIRGPDAVVDAVRRCWASLWTERAVAYRTSNGIDHRAASLAAVVQVMVPATVSGVLFTANPLTNRHHEIVVDAAPGLGEALVSGQVNPDHFVVEPHTRTITERRLVGAHPTATTLTDDQLLTLADLGAAVETHFGVPQDIEWALDPDGCLWVLQSRPITTLFPQIPARPNDALPLRAYFSANVAQGVLQPLTPMGIDYIRQVGVAAGALAGIPSDPVRGPAAVAVAAERLYFDLTPLLRTRWGRRVVTAALGRMEPRTGEIIQDLLADPRLAPVAATSRRASARRVFSVLRRTWLPARVAYAFLLPARARRAASAPARALLAAAARPVGTPREALDRAQWLARQVPPRIVVPLFPSALVVGAGSLFAASALARAVGADDMAHVTGGLPHNVTTEMNLMLWEISLHVRQDPPSAAILGATPAHELAERFKQGQLPAVVQHDVARFLERYGFRAVAEFDLGVPRWVDDPTHVFGVLSNYLRLPAGELAPDAQFQRSAAEADAAMARVIARARAAGPRGYVRAVVLRLLFRRMRELLGTREAPKFYLIAVGGQVRSLLRQVGTALADARHLEQPDDIFFVTFAEARSALAGTDQRALVRERRSTYARELQRRRIPRVLLSDGTTLYGEQAVHGDGTTLSGTPASPGVYSGVARVIMDPAGARLEPGEVLVAPSTDPGWTPLFMTAGALVMEMGGMMSHGSVVAREYGIPAVVGAVGATTVIRSGQRITVDGGRGVVLLAEARDEAPSTEGVA